MLAIRLSIVLFGVLPLIAYLSKYLWRAFKIRRDKAGAGADLRCFSFCPSEQLKRQFGPQLFVSYNWKIGFMSRRKVWSQQEDAVLRLLREQRGLKKWSQIAKKMAEEFGITQRTGKQCRQRYHNHLDSSIVLRQWSQEEEETLRALHAQLGNKWSLISQQLPGRSDNCVKNHFYSKLRRAMRKLNRLLHESKASLPSRHIQPSLLNNLIELTEQRFKSTSRHDEYLIEKSVQIVDCLFRLEQTLSLGGETAEVVVRRLVDDATWVESRLKKGAGGIRELKEGSETGQEREKKDGRVTKVDDPFYEAFRRVCESIVLDNN